MKKIILASTSPRRRELLKQAGFSFDICPPDYEEHMENKLFSYEFIKSIAENKGKSVIKTIKDSAAVISADTVVIYDNKILGKPKNYEEAYTMLTTLKGKSHKVVTAVCVIDHDSGKKIINTETSEVVFNNVADEEIKEYINNFKPYDKAGSYGIQELPSNFVKEIKGDYDNIVGLPVRMLIKMLEKIQLV